MNAPNWLGNIMRKFGIRIGDAKPKFPYAVEQYLADCRRSREIGVPVGERDLTDSIVASLEPEEEAYNRLFDPEASMCFDTETIGAMAMDSESNDNVINLLNEQLIAEYCPPQVLSFDQVMAPALAVLDFTEDPEILDQVKAACEAKDAEGNAEYLDEPGVLFGSPGCDTHRCGDEGDLND